MTEPVMIDLFCFRKICIMPRRSQSSWRKKGKSPKLGGATLEPEIEDATLDPKIEDATLDPKIEDATLDPKGEDATLDPKCEEATLDPQCEEATLNDERDQAEPKLSWGQQQLAIIAKEREEGNKPVGCRSNK